MVGVGILWAIASAICSGTAAIASKLRRVQKANVSPIYFAFWSSLGVVLSSLPLLAIPGFEFLPVGMISGALFVLATLHAYAAVKLLGFYVAAWVWSGTAVVVSFFYGVQFAGDTVAEENVALAHTGLALLLVGFFLLMLNCQLFSWWRSRRDEQEALRSVALSEQGIEAPLLNTSSAKPQQPGVCMRVGRGILGIAAGLIAGWLGGLILAPLTAVPPDLRNLRYVPSMAAGVVITAGLLTPLALLVAGRPFARPSLAVGAPIGILSGVIWNLGNMASILAATDSSVGLAVAYPIMQCGTFVACGWGIILLRDLQGWREHLGYWAAGGVLVAGCAFLASAHIMPGDHL